jgi:hypothetical protein
MQLDYWNHPLIVKAIRVKYRGGRLFTFVASYLLLLLAGGVLLFHYRYSLGIKDWARVYFVCMISLQFVFSAIIAISATSSSMQAEVATRTLDFQRIAAIRPLDILMGKAIGEPAASYLLALSTVPIAVLCCAMGNVALWSVLLLYVTLATTTFMMACLGLQHSLDPASKGAQAAGLTGGFIFATFMATSMPIRFGPRGGFLELLSAAVGLFTPILSIKGIALDGSTMWTAGMPFFDVTIPYALLTPFAQMALASLALLFMTRRLTQPLITPMSKSQSYVALLILDLLWAALQFNALHLGEGLTAPAVRFAAGHTILALLLVGRTTPGRETFQSWAWRLRGKRNLFLDHLVGERTLNPLTLFAYCLIAPAVFVAAIAIPVIVWHPDVLALTDWPGLLSAGATCVMVIAAYGLLYQLASLTIGKGAAITVFVLATLLVLGPWVLGVIYELPWLMGLSPFDMFIRLQDPSSEPYSTLPLIALHVVAIAFWAWGLTKMAQRILKQVDRRLVSMGVATAVAAG